MLLAPFLISLYGMDACRMSNPFCKIQDFVTDGLQMIHMRWSISYKAVGDGQERKQVRLPLRFGAIDDCGPDQVYKPSKRLSCLCNAVPTIHKE